MTEFFLDYRKVDMTPTEVIVEVIVPLTGEDEYSASFKQARRREDDIAIVTSGMRVKFQQPPSSSSSPAVSAVPLIDNITMSFGGMWKTTICATKTQAKLRGLPWTLETVRLACAEMGTSFSFGDIPVLRCSHFATTVILITLVICHHCSHTLSLKCR